MPPPAPPKLPSRFPAGDLEGESSDESPAKPDRPAVDRPAFLSVTALRRPSPPRQTGSALVPTDGEAYLTYLAELSGAESENERIGTASVGSEEEKGRYCCGPWRASRSPGDSPPPEEKSAPEEKKGPKVSTGTWALCMLLEAFLTLNFVFVQSQLGTPERTEAKPKDVPQVQATKWAVAQLEQLEKFQLNELGQMESRTALTA